MNRFCEGFTPNLTPPLSSSSSSFMTGVAEEQTADQIYSKIQLPKAYTIVV